MTEASDAALAAADMIAKIEKQKKRLEAMKQQQALRRHKKEVTAWVRTASTRNLKLEEIDPSPPAAPASPASASWQQTAPIPKPTNSANTKVDHILILVSNLSGNPISKQQQQRAVLMFETLGIKFETLNCALPEHKEKRDQLFQTSGVRGNFPQFFTCITTASTSDDSEANRDYNYVGQFYDMDEINEKSGMTPDMLMPFDVTWDKLLGTSESQMYYQRVQTKTKTAGPTVAQTSSQTAALVETATPVEDSLAKTGLDPPAVSSTETDTANTITTTTVEEEVAVDQTTSKILTDNAARILQRFLKSCSPWWKEYSKQNINLQTKLAVISKEAQAELTALKADIQQQKEEFQIELKSEDREKAVKKLMKKMAQEQKKGIQYKKELKHETKRTKLIQKINKAQEKTDKQQSKFFKVKAKVFKQQGIGRRLEENIDLVMQDNQKILSTIQNVAEKLDQRGLSWDQIKNQGEGNPTTTGNKGNTKKWWIPTVNAAAAAAAADNNSNSNSSNKKGTENEPPMGKIGEGAPSEGETGIRPAPREKQLSKKQASKRALMLAESSQPSSVWCRSGGAGRRPSHLLNRLANQRKMDIDLSSHE